MTSSSSSMAVRITNISLSSVCSGNRISSICHAISIVAPLIGSNALAHRHNIHTSAEDQSLGLEGRGTAGRMPRGTKNRRSQRTHRWAPYIGVRDAEGADIWSAYVGRHGGLRGTASFVKSTVISVDSALRHVGPSRCSRMPTRSLHLAATLAMFSWDHDDGGSRGVTWADQQTGGMPSGGSDRVGTAPTQLGVGGDEYGDNGTGSGGWTEESDQWSSGGGPRLGGVQQESSDKEQDDGSTGDGAGSVGGHDVGLLSCTFGSSAQYTNPDFTDGHFFALQFALTDAYPPSTTCCPRLFQTASPARLSGLATTRLPCMGPAAACSCTTNGARFPRRLCFSSATAES